MCYKSHFPPDRVLNFITIFYLHVISARVIVDSLSGNNQQYNDSILCVRSIEIHVCALPAASMSVSACIDMDLIIDKYMRLKLLEVILKSQELPNMCHSIGEFM